MKFDCGIKSMVNNIRITWPKDILRLEKARPTVTDKRQQNKVFRRGVKMFLFMKVKHKRV